MKIAIVSPVFPPYRGGIGVVAERDAQELRDYGNDVSVFTPAYRNRTEKSLGVIHLQPFFAWGNGAILFSLLTKLRHFDIVHLHFPFFGSDILVALACKFWNIPLVVTYHMRPKAKGILGATFEAYRFVLQPFVFRVARMLLVSSEDYAIEQKIQHRRRMVLPFRVNTHRFRPGNRCAAQQHFGLVQNRPVILFVGGLDSAHYFKGVDVLLRACADMKSSWQLLIVGDGNRRQDFECLARGLMITDRVHFVGAVSHNDLPLAYQAADVHVLPSIDRSEAFGLVTEEAMASGIPSIVSDLPGVRTLVSPNKTGLRVPPGDVAALTLALDRLCCDELLRKDFGVRARGLAEKEYADEKITMKLLHMYKTLVLGQE